MPQVSADEDRREEVVVKVLEGMGDWGTSGGWPPSAGRSTHRTRRRMSLGALLLVGRSGGSGNRRQGQQLGVGRKQRCQKLEKREEGTKLSSQNPGSGWTRGIQLNFQGSIKAILK